jgi:hypothetical protein
VFQKDHKQFGKKHLFDDKEATCWNSDQGLPQHINIKFEKKTMIKGVRYMGQGGFCPREVVIYGDGGEIMRCEVPDSNFEQTIKVESVEIESVKVEFTKASDLFGRIIMYKFEILG